MGIVMIILAALMTVAAVIFLVWFWGRTPRSLARWYCTPVTLFTVAIVAVAWVSAIALLITA